jgi:hypothetical protein
LARQTRRWLAIPKLSANLKVKTPLQPGPKQTGGVGILTLAYAVHAVRLKTDHVELHTIGAFGLRLHHMRTPKCGIPLSEFATVSNTASGIEGTKTVAGIHEERRRTADASAPSIQHSPLQQAVSREVANQYDDTCSERIPGDDEERTVVRAIGRIERRGNAG